MLVFEGLDTVTHSIEQSTVAIGAFDGIHAGHQAIIQRAVQDARGHGRPAIVFTFDRHPAELLRPDRAPEYLTTPKQRIELIESLGADQMVIARFDAALSQLSPEQFVSSILVGLLGAKHVVVGADFRFGREREGDVAYLESVSERFGFTVRALSAVRVGELAASSTRIRELIQAGEVSSAETVLGHAFLLHGTVAKGKQLGRTLGFPTANLERSYRQVVPKNGIYAVQVKIPSSPLWLPGACSIGVRPTVQDGRTERTIETYLLDFEQDIYGVEMEIRFLRYLRPELKFSSLDALVQQMNRDVAEVREMFLSTDCGTLDVQLQTIDAADAKGNDDSD